jgi:bifunctional non-homologous end joining protein LigD
MALDEYRRKRDFAKSPEPDGSTRRRAIAGRLFCVQKHLASHLHYDLRLELNGVLLSWAVPKGPSIDPAVKRFAVHVEDHPVAYGSFEGVIPEGYGAGIVMLWDTGAWEPQVPDVEAALKKGDLKFKLNGYKLKGSWALVRTKSASGRDWLLLKHRDEWSGPLDIAEFAPLSVKSGGDFEDILADGNPAVWFSSRPAKSGETSALFTRIIERAVEMKAARIEGRRSRKQEPRSSPGPSGPGSPKVRRQKPEAGSKRRQK